MFLRLVNDMMIALQHDAVLKKKKINNDNKKV